MSAKQRAAIIAAVWHCSLCAKGQMGGRYRRGLSVLYVCRYCGHESSDPIRAREEKRDRVERIERRLR